MDVALPPCAPTLEPRDPEYAAKVRQSFERQDFMAHLGARLVRVDPGVVEIELPFRQELTQQHGFVHAGATTAVADSAGGYAAFSLMPAGSSVLTIEFKVNLIRPAEGRLFRARGRVVKAGRIHVTELGVWALVDGGPRQVLAGQQTVLCVTDGLAEPG